MIPSEEQTVVCNIIMFFGYRALLNHILTVLLPTVISLIVNVTYILATVLQPLVVGL